MVNLYPDCYLTNGIKGGKTTIRELPDNGGSKIVKYNHPYFEGLFNAAWNIHLGIKMIEDRDNPSLYIYFDEMKQQLELWEQD